MRWVQDRHPGIDQFLLWCCHPRPSLVSTYHVFNQLPALPLQHPHSLGYIHQPLALDLLAQETGSTEDPAPAGTIPAGQSKGRHLPYISWCPTSQKNSCPHFTRAETGAVSCFEGYSWTVAQAAPPKDISHQQVTRMCPSWHCRWCVSTFPSRLMMVAGCGGRCCFMGQSSSCQNRTSTAAFLG